MKVVRYDSQTKLEPIVVSLLTGCAYLSEVNTKLKSEQALSEVWHYSGFADQSQLSLYLDRLTPQNVSELGQAVGEIWRSRSQVLRHDWRQILTVDLDLSGLACSKRYTQHGHKFKMKSHHNTCEEQMHHLAGGAGPSFKVCGSP